MSLHGWCQCLRFLLGCDAVGSNADVKGIHPVKNYLEQWTTLAFSAKMLLDGWQEEHLARKKL